MCIRDSISVPVTNMLLENTSVSQSDTRSGFGKDDMPNMKNNEKQEFPQGMMGQGKQYVMEINSATDMMVVLQVCGIAVLLVMISSSVAIMSILRYEPVSYTHLSDEKKEISNEIPIRLAPDRIFLPHIPSL